MPLLTNPLVAPHPKCGLWMWIYMPGTMQGAASRVINSPGVALQVGPPGPDPIKHPLLKQMDRPSVLARYVLLDTF